MIQETIARDRSRSNEKPSKFRVDSKSWFLTYPRLDMSKEQALEALKVKLAGKPYKGMVVCKELHADGTPHIHAYVLLENTFNCKNASFWDLNGHHGNYQKARDIFAVAQYIKKDGDYIEEGSIDWKEKLEAKKDHRRCIYKQLLEGADLAKVTDENPELLRGLRSLGEDLAYYRVLKASPKPRCQGFIPNTWGLILPVIQTKKRHYWFWSSKPNKGKTTFLNSIKDQFPAMSYTWAEKYQRLVKDAQFVILDEYSTGHLTVTQLNIMCDGGYQYPVKGASAFELDTPILLVCGNKSPLDIYGEQHHDLLQARFTIHCLD